MGVKFTGPISIPQGSISYKNPLAGPADALFSDVVLLSGFNNSFVDDSNSNHTPTVVGSATTSTTDAYFSGNSVGQFPGTGLDSDYVDYPISSDFRLEPTQDWTFELFLRPTNVSANSYRAVLWFWDGSFLTFDPAQAPTARGFGLYILRSGLSPSIAFRYITADVIRTTISGPVLTVNTWYYAAIVNDGASHTATFYINGSSVGTGNLGTVGLGVDLQCSVARTKAELSSGSDLDFAGQIEEVRVTRAKRTITSTPTAEFPRHG